MEEDGSLGDIVQSLRSCQESWHLLDETQIENGASVGSGSISLDDKMLVGHGMHTLSCSWTGMCSATATMSGISASMDSSMASVALLAATYTAVASGLN